MLTPVLSTKKLNLDQQNRLLNKGYQLVEWDFITTEYIDIQLDRIGNLLLFTSQNAVKSILRNRNIDSLKQITTICVGEKTADLLTRNGWKVLCYREYATELGDYILQNHTEDNITFFCGNLRRDVLPNILKNNNITHKEYEVYRTNFCSREIEIPIKAILFFSPSGVISYMQKNLISDQICFCIGTTTANEALKYTKNVVIAKKPTIDCVIDACTGYFEKDYREVNDGKAI
ncbi:uroporphyrinogen-III synthase [Capnocytophaga canis]|uniref:uroporphyrinogen-III synthase n=1 Tax=Capnocytophaga canis TaxID=1848903 RepID=UPI003858CF2C